MNVNQIRHAGDSSTPTVRMNGLTARGVKMRLSRAKVDYSALTITEGVVTSRRVDFDGSGPWRALNVVTIAGPREARRAASEVLYDAGLSCAPYPDRGEWHA
jgi:hypothetical protein